MRKVIAAILVVSVALFAASMLGVAVAEAPTGTPVRTVSVTGVGAAPIPQKAGASEANAAYREAMAAAVADGKGKAEFLIAKVGGSLSAIQSLSEGGGHIECTPASTSGEPTEYAEYEGERPDYPSSSQGPPYATPLAAARRAPVRSRKHRKHKHPTAKKASSAPGNCKVSAQVSLVYTIA